MFLVNWFKGLLGYLGLHHKKGTVLFLGLDNAGKTTLLAKLKDDRVAVHQPTLHPNSEVLQVGSLVITTHDLGGHLSARRLWAEYFGSADGIVYIVDAADTIRFEEAKSELAQLLECEELQVGAAFDQGNQLLVWVNSGAACFRSLRAVPLECCLLFSRQPSRL
jgi:GTP-binding protein SAR1